MNKIEVPIKIQEHFKDKWINYTIYETDSISFYYYDNFEQYLEFSIKKCKCSEVFLDFF